MWHTIDYSHMSHTTSFTLIHNNENDHWKENTFTILNDNNDLKMKNITLIKFPQFILKK